jgi:two-component system heavy metal sensor histidine kinase CusS
VRIHPDLSTRLGLLFAAVTAALLCAVGLYLYVSFARTEASHEADELRGKAALLRHVAERAATEAALMANHHALEEVVIGHPRLSIRLYGRDGLLWESGRAALRGVERSLAASAGAEPVIVTQRIGAGSPERQLKTASFEAALGSPTVPPVTFVLALDVTAGAAALRDFRDRLLVTLVAATALGAAFGYAAVRWTLHRFDTLGHALRELTAERLGQRLDEAAFPDELRSHAQGYNAMVDRLERSFERLKAYASDIAHELRTPLNTMLLGTQVTLTKPRSAPEYREALEAHAEETAALARMVDDMLFLARAENAAVALRGQPVDLAAEARAAAAYYRALSDERGIRIAVRGEASIVADRALLQRVLSNLLGNAIRHGAANKPVAIDIARERAAVTLVVRNAGPAIPPQRLARLFDRFYTGDTARSADAGGSGLGLAIVKAIVGLHDGQTAVASDAKQTRFAVTLPIDSRTQWENK